jgi:hypothetical protein
MVLFFGLTLDKLRYHDYYSLVPLFSFDLAHALNNLFPYRLAIVDRETAAALKTYIERHNREALLQLKLDYQTALFYHPSDEYQQAMTRSSR